MTSYCEPKIPKKWKLGRISYFSLRGKMWGIRRGRTVKGKLLYLFLGKLAFDFSSKENR